MNSIKLANVTVIIPCYCCFDTVERALRSVVGQSLLPREIILVDDSSDDEGQTLLTLKKLINDFNSTASEIRLIALKNNVGAAGARNAAWDLASSDLVAVLDSDDAWHPRKIEIQYQWMKEHPMVALSGHLYSQVDENGEPSDVPSSFSAKPCDFRSMLFKNPLVTRTVMLRRDIPLRFAMGKRYAEDYLLWLQTMALGLQVFILSVDLAYSFKSSYGESGLSGNMWAMEQGVQDNFIRLYKDQEITLVTFLLASLFSFLKYFRRVMIVSLRRTFLARPQ